MPFHHNQVPVSASLACYTYVCVGVLSIQSVTIFITKHHPPPPTTQVSTMVNLGNVWGDLGDSSLKKEYLERALSLQEALLKEKSSPPTFLELATILHNLGAAYGDTGDFWKQRDALERALRIKEAQVKLGEGEGGGGWGRGDDVDV